MKRTRTLITLAIALVALTIGLTLSQWQDAVDLNPAPAPTGPALVLTGVQAQGFNEQGQPTYWLRALAISRYETKPPKTLLSMPWLEVHDGERQWVFTALRGRVKGQNERIMLDGRVRGYSLNSQLKIETQRLLYWPESGRVKAPHSVLIHHPGGHTRAGGMQAVVPEGRVKLTGGVTTYYVPAS